MTPEKKTTPGEWLMAGAVAALAAVALSHIKESPKPPEPVTYVEFDLAGKTLIDGDKSEDFSKLVIRTIKCSDGSLYFNEASLESDRSGKVRDHAACKGNELDISLLSLD